MAAKRSGRAARAVCALAGALILGFLVLFALSKLLAGGADEGPARRDAGSPISLSNALYPAGELELGARFDFSGAIRSQTGLDALLLSVTDANGTVLQKHAVYPEGDSFDLGAQLAGVFRLERLGEGAYAFRVLASADGREYLVIDSAFSIAPAPAGSSGPAGSPSPAALPSVAAQSLYAQYRGPYALEDVSGAVDALAARCLAEASTDEERARWMHDFLIDSAEYDDSCSYYYAEGVLLYGRGVCQSYATAFQLLMEAVGVECRMVTGEADGGSGAQPHAWNMIRLEGDWYHVDCTWDDGDARYAYYCAPDWLMARGHRWQAANYPACTELTFNYYYRTGGLFRDSAADLRRALSEALDLQQARIYLCLREGWSGEVVSELAAEVFEARLDWRSYSGYAPNDYSLLLEVAYQ